MNCGYARTAIYQLYLVTKKTNKATSSSSKDDQQTSACGEEPSTAGENVRVDNSTVGISVPQCEHGDTVGMQEGECTAAQQGSHEHIKATNASMPELSQNPLKIFREIFNWAMGAYPKNIFKIKANKPQILKIWRKISTGCI